MQVQLGTSGIDNSEYPGVFDISQLHYQFGGAYTMAYTYTPVPEPPSIAICGLLFGGWVGLPWLKRRRAASLAS